MDKVCEMVAGVKAMGLETCMTLGMLTGEQARQLKDAGLDYYNHNIDTSPEHYGEIISTRTFQERLDTLEEVREAGISVCCGGIVGMGETREDRVGFIHALATLPRHPELPMTARYLPASRNAEIGGDFYDVVELDGRMLITIGDVCGHSIEAATVMGEVRHTLRAYAVDGHSPASILRRLDTVLARFHPVGGLTTVCLLSVDLRSGTMLVANAGHVPPLVADDRGARYLPVKGPLLGLGLARPDEVEVPLPKGTTVLLTTDGLVERPGTDLDEGMELLRAAVSPTGDMDDLADRLLADFGADKQDDIALVLLRRV